jgi:hypothetical protein
MTTTYVDEKQCIAWDGHKKCGFVKPVNGIPIAWFDKKEICQIVDYETPVSVLVSFR